MPAEHGRPAVPGKESGMGVGLFGPSRPGQLMPHGACHLSALTEVCVFAVGSQRD